MIRILLSVIFIVTIGGNAAYAVTMQIGNIAASAPGGVQLNFFQDSFYAELSLADHVYIEGPVNTARFIRSLSIGLDFTIIPDSGETEINYLFLRKVVISRIDNSDEGIFMWGPYGGPYDETFSRRLNGQEIFTGNTWYQSNCGYVGYIVALTTNYPYSYDMFSKWVVDVTLDPGEVFDFTYQITEYIKIVPFGVPEPSTMLLLGSGLIGLLGLRRKFKR